MYRDRRTLLIIVPVLTFLLITTSVYLSGGYITQAVFPKLRLSSTNGAGPELLGTLATPETETEAEIKDVLSPTPSTSDESSSTPIAPTSAIPDGLCLRVQVAQTGADAQQELFSRVLISKNMSMPFSILLQRHSIVCNVRH